MNIFLRLAGFHQLMRFLGPKCSLIEGSGLRSALETVYAPVSVGHMFSAKAYSCAIRGHFLSTSALLSIMLERFWNELNTNEKNDMKTMHESDNPSVFKDDEISTYLKMTKYLLHLFLGLSKDKISYLKAKFKLLHIRFMVKLCKIYQEFIPAETSSNWPLHILATQSILTQQLC